MVIEDFYEGISHPRNSTLMRVFLNMGLTEHTGHGVPTIIEKYGKEAFEITDNYIKCKIPFDRKVLELSDKNVGLNVGLNKTEKDVYATRGTSPFGVAVRKFPTSMGPVVALLKQANTDSSKMAEVIGVSDAQLRFVTNSQSGMGLLKCGNVVIPFDNQISKDTSLYKLCNTNLHEIIQEQKAKEKQKNS